MPRELPPKIRNFQLLLLTLTYNTFLSAVLRSPSHSLMLTVFRLYSEEKFSPLYRVDPSRFSLNTFFRLNELYNFSAAISNERCKALPNRGGRNNNGGILMEVEEKNNE